MIKICNVQVCFSSVVTLNSKNECTCFGYNTLLRFKRTKPFGLAHDNKTPANKYQKPINLMERLICMTAKKNDLIIADVSCGTTKTAVNTC